LEERTRRLRSQDITKYLIEWSNKLKEKATWDSATFAREVGLIEDNDLCRVGRDVTSQINMVKVRLKGKSKGEKDVKKPLEAKKTLTSLKKAKKELK